MVKKFLEDGTDDPFEQASMSIQDADAILYGSVDVPESGRVIARPIAIDAVRPDFRQPRRAIPLLVRGRWDGNPDDLGEVLDDFHEYAEAEYGTIFVEAILRGREELVVPQEQETDMPIFSRYANLILLAQNIANEGLTNPITVVNKGNGQYQVETGERRWLAYHLLAKYLDPETYGKIPAREVEYDPYRQASENNARNSLDSIGLARQVAVLIMAELDHEHHYTSIEKISLPGENDRRFYAQVANGYVHKVAPASRRKIQKAIRGLSWSSLSQYRALLALTGDDEVDDALWLAADTYGWSEGAMRELKVAREWDDAFSDDYIKQMKVLIGRDDWDLSDLHELKNQFLESFTIVKLQKEREEKEKLTQSKPLPTDGAGQETSYETYVPDGKLMYMWVRLGNGAIGQVRKHNVETGKIAVKHDSGSVTYCHVRDVEAWDIDVSSGKSPEEKKLAQELWAKPVFVTIDGEKIRGIVHAVQGLDRVDVLFKNGQIERFPIDAISVDAESLAPNKAGSTTLNDYMDNPPNGFQVTPSDTQSVSPDADSDDEAIEDDAFVIGTTVQALTMDGRQLSGTIVSIAGGLYTVSTSDGEMPFHVWQLTPWAIDNSSVNPPDDGDGKIFGQWDRKVFYANILAMARSMGDEDITHQVEAFKDMTASEVTELRGAGELHEYLGSIFTEVERLLDWVRDEVENDLARIEDGT